MVWPSQEKVSDDVAGKKVRARAKAQGRALQRLKNNNEEEYKGYYEEEVEKAFREAGLIP